jgi:hypothetical protein
MSIYNIKLLRCKEVSEGPVVFIFKKPEGFTYKAVHFE